MALLGEVQAVDLVVDLGGEVHEALVVPDAFPALEHGGIRDLLAGGRRLARGIGYLLPGHGAVLGHHGRLQEPL